MRTYFVLFTGKSFEFLNLTVHGVFLKPHPNILIFSVLRSSQYLEFFPQNLTYFYLGGVP